MKTLWFAIVLLAAMWSPAIVASSAAAQEQTCDAQIRTANDMMKEFMQHVHIMSDRAARHYAVAETLRVALAVANAEITRLSKEK